jgi:DNA-binding FadR family transcriptional regulator
MTEQLNALVTRIEQLVDEALDALETRMLDDPEFARTAMRLGSKALLAEMRRLCTQRAILEAALEVSNPNGQQLH